jgi:hypothetical protein
LKSIVVCAASGALGVPTSTVAASAAGIRNRERNMKEAG